MQLVFEVQRQVDHVSDARERPDDQLGTSTNQQPRQLLSQKGLGIWHNTSVDVGIASWYLADFLDQHPVRHSVVVLRHVVERAVVDGVHVEEVAPETLVHQVVDERQEPGRTDQSLQ